MSNKFLILSIDGGGTRGIIPATIIQRLHQDLNNNRPITDEFDLMAGTSTGGILCTGLAYGKSPEDMVNLYLKDSKNIFFDTIWDNTRDMGTLRGANYSHKRFKNILKSYFGTDTLATIRTKLNPQDTTTSTESKRFLMVCSFDLNPTNADQSPRNYEPRVFQSDFRRDQDESLVDLCLKTSAGPTYFPIYDGFIDGGVALNHPAMAAITFAMNNHSVLDGSNEYRHPDGTKKGLAKSLSDIKVLSIGTGTSGMNYIDDGQIGNGDWGTWRWKDHIANMLTETNMTASEYYVSNILPKDQYLRVQVNFQDYPDSILYRDFIQKNEAVDLDVKEDKHLKAMIDIANQRYEALSDQIMNFLSN
ncbi:MAG: patatin-like phospholipase family protein [Cyclobacteriaceae bacterium]